MIREKYIPKGEKVAEMVLVATSWGRASHHGMAVPPRLNKLLLLYLKLIYISDPSHRPTHVYRRLGTIL